jgi:hypothetical protein
MQRNTRCWLVLYDRDGECLQRSTHWARKTGFLFKEWKCGIFMKLDDQVNWATQHARQSDYGFVSRVYT